MVRFALICVYTAVSVFCNIRTAACSAFQLVHLKHARWPRPSRWRGRAHARISRQRARLLFSFARHPLPPPSPPRPLSPACPSPVALPRAPCPLPTPVYLRIVWASWAKRAWVCGWVVPGRGAGGAQLAAPGGRRRGGSSVGRLARGTRCRPPNLHIPH